MISKMNNKNHYKKIFLTLVAAALFMVSCKDEFLEINPTGSLANAQLATKAGVEGSLVGAYSALNGVFGNRFEGPNHWITGTICGGDANKGTDPGDYSSINPIQRYETDATSGDLNAFWRARYEGIARANETLRLLAAATDVTTDDVARISAEARLLRGHYYFDLKKHFNKVPYFDETIVAPDEISAVSNAADIWDKIEADFQYAMDNLPETMSQAGRNNKWAAAAYLAKAKLFQGDFSGAKTLFDNVIANGQTVNGKTYGLVPAYAEIFNAANDNHEEAVFDVESAINSGSTQNANYFDDLNYPYNTGTDGPGNCCGFNQPSFDLVNAFRTSSGLPLLDNSYNDDANAVKHDYGVEADVAFEPDGGPLDPRLDHSVGRRGIPYLDWIPHPGKAWIRNQTYAGPFSPKKYIYYKSQENTLTDGSSWTRGYATMNYTIIRYADVLLMAAEAEVEVGSLEKAREYVNLVRARAANSDHWVKNADGTNAADYQIELYNDAWTDQGTARTAVRFERRLELSGEGHRFFDLVRWGIAGETLNAYLANEAKILVTKFGGASFTTGKNEYFPIPQEQIDIQGSDVLTQNPGY